MKKTWFTKTVKEYDVAKVLNSLEEQCFVIFSLHRLSGGFSDSFMVVYYKLESL